MKQLTASLLALAAASVGCAADFDPVSELRTVRVVAVQKDTPYAKPAADVTLTMAWADSRPAVKKDPPAELPVTVSWLVDQWTDPAHKDPICNNPIGDLYYGCFEKFAERLASVTPPGGASGTPPPSGAPLPVPGLFPTGDQLTIRIPADLIEKHPAPLDPAVPRYGLVYVFFAACAGTLAVSPAKDQFPVLCLGSDGRPLGTEDFVAGYTAIYVYERLTNKNPAIGGFTVNGHDVDTDCIGTDCMLLPEPAAVCSTTGDTPCIEACPDNADVKKCNGYPIKPILDPSIVDADPIVSGNLSEQMWISYLTESGQFDHQLRLLNDASGGWNKDYGTKFYPPARKGPTHIWAVVRDNRGGVNWTRMTVVIR